MDKSVTVGILIGGSVSPSVGSAFRSLDQRFRDLSTTAKRLKIGQGLTEDIPKLGKALQELRERAANTVHPLASHYLNQEIASTEKRLNAAKEAAHKFGLDMGNLTRESGQLGTALRKTEAALAATETRMRNRAIRSDVKGSLLETGAQVFTVRALLKPAIDYESAMADVSKVVDFASKEEEKLFAKTILDRSKVIPVAAEGLAQIAAAGGSLGIAKNQLMDFTTVVSKISTAFGMTASESGDAIAKIMNVYGLSVKQAERLGDAINQLGNTTAAKEKDIVDVLARVGGAGKMFGLAGKEVASLATGFLALGRTPEMAGTAINALLTKLNTADKQGKKFQEGLAAIGTSGVDLKNAIEQNPQKALTDFLEKVKAMPKKEQMGILTDMFGMEYSDDIALLLTGLDQYKTALKETANETKFAGSMQKEFETRSKTTANQLQLLKNTVTAGAINLGNLFLPGLNSVVGPLRSLTDVLGGLAQGFPFLTKVVGGLVIGLVALKVASLGGRYAMSFLSDGLAIARLAIANLHPRVLALNIAILKTKAAGLGQTVAGWGTSLRSFAANIPPAITTMKAWTATQWTALRANTLNAASLKVLGRSFGTTLLTGLRAGIAGVRAFSVALLTSPVGWIGLAIGAAALLIYKFWGPITGFFKGLWAGLKAGLKGLEPAWNIFKAVAPLFAPILIPLKLIWNALKALFKPMTDTGKAAENMGVRIGKAVGNILTSVLILPAKMLQAGKNIINSLWEGMKSMIDKPVELLKSLTQKLRNLLPFSPAKDGPLKDIHKIRLVETIAETVKPKPLVNAMRAATAAALIAVTPVMPVAAGGPLGPTAKSVPPLPQVQQIKQVLQPAKLVPVGPPPLAVTTPPRSLPVKAASDQTPANRNGALTVNFHPTITVQGGGDPAKVQAAVAQANKTSLAEFEKMMKRVMAQQERRKF